MTKGAVRRRQQKIHRMFWFLFIAHCSLVPFSASPAQSTDWTLPSQLVSGRKPSEVKSVDPRISSPHGESDTRV